MNSLAPAEFQMSKGNAGRQVKIESMLTLIPKIFA